MLVKLWERQLDAQSKIMFKTVKDSKGKDHEVAVAESYYMELDEKQERELLGRNKKYSVDRVFPEEEAKISEADLKKGANKKAELFPGAGPEPINE